MLWQGAYILVVRSYVCFRYRILSVMGLSWTYTMGYMGPWESSFEFTCMCHWQESVKGPIPYRVLSRTWPGLMYLTSPGYLQVVMLWLCMLTCKQNNAMVCSRLSWFEISKSRLYRHTAANLRKMTSHNHERTREGKIHSVSTVSLWSVNSACKKIYQVA